MRIYLIGFMGAGKSYWGNQLSKHFQAPFFDLDDYIVAQETKSINEIFAERGEEYFRLAEHHALIKLSQVHEHFILATGGGTPCFHLNMDYMNANGKTIWLNPSVDVLVQRLENEKEHRPLLKSLNSSELKVFVEQKLIDRIKFYEKSSVIVNNDVNLTVDDLIKLIQHA